MSVVYRSPEGVTLASTPVADAAYEKRLDAAGIKWVKVVVADPPAMPAVGAFQPTGTHAADINAQVPGSRFVYHSKHGGAALATLLARDPAYEKQLDRNFLQGHGPDWDVLEVADHAHAPQHHQLQRASVRDTNGDGVRDAVQFDREEVTH